MLELRERDLDAFFDTPFEAYGDDSPYVSPLKSDLARFLDPAANPLFVHAGVGTYYTAHRHGRPVGRIVAHVHRASNERHGLRRAFFGFFDCAADTDAAERLLGAAEGFARDHGCDEVAGNFNLTAMQQMGVVTDGFERAAYTEQQYNPAHVPELLRGHGFEPVFPMTTFELELSRFEERTLLTSRVRERLEDPELRWRRIRAGDLPGILDEIRQVLNDGFMHNPMFVPLTQEEIEFQSKDLTYVIDPRLSVLVHDDEGPAGALVCIPDINPLLRAIRSRFGWTAPYHYLRHRLRRRRAVVLFSSVARRMQNRGLGGAMSHRLIDALRTHGYERLGLTWISDRNGPSLRQAEKIGARPLHRLHLFRKKLGEPAPRA